VAQSDPSNGGWQHGLSVSYEKVGDVQVAQGDLTGALKSYRRSLAISERLAQSDPGNAAWQRDLAISYERLADVYRQLKDRAKALAKGSSKSVGGGAPGKSDHGPPGEALNG
jgi:tetratricopeptide (TPR) repeat protein